MALNNKEWHIFTSNIQALPQHTFTHLYVLHSKYVFVPKVEIQMPLLWHCHLKCKLKIFSFYKLNYDCLHQWHSTEICCVQMQTQKQSKARQSTCIYWLMTLNRFQTVNSAVNCGQIALAFSGSKGQASQAKLSDQLAYKCLIKSQKSFVQMFEKWADKMRFRLFNSRRWTDYTDFFPGFFPYLSLSAVFDTPPPWKYIYIVESFGRKFFIIGPVSVSISSIFYGFI